MTYTFEQKVIMFNRQEFWVRPPNGVTDLWSVNAWINWIDKEGGWIPSPLFVIEAIHEEKERQ